MSKKESADDTAITRVVRRGSSPPTSGPRLVAFMLEGSLVRIALPVLLALPVDVELGDRMHEEHAACDELYEGEADWEDVEDSVDALLCVPLRLGVRECDGVDDCVRDIRDGVGLPLGVDVVVGLRLGERLTL